MQAAENVLQAQAAAAAGTHGSSSGGGDGGSQEWVLPDLPPPMVPGNADSPTSLCAMQVGERAEAGGGLLPHMLLEQLLLLLGGLIACDFTPKLSLRGCLVLSHAPCLKERFQPMAAAMRGFAWRAERPDAAAFVDQKWGYSANGTGGRAALGSCRRASPG